MTIPIYKLGADAKGKPFHALKYVGNDAMSRSGVLYASHKLRCSLIPSFAWQSVEMTNYDCECILRKARVLWLNAGAFQHLFSKKAMSALSCWLPLGLACDHFVPFCDLWPEVLYLWMNILQHSPLDFGFLICFYKIMCTLTFCPFGAWWHGPQAQGSCMMGRCELASLCCTSATCGSPRGPVSCTSFQFFFFGIVLRLTEPVVMYCFAHEARNEWRFSQGYWWRPSCVSFSFKSYQIVLFLGWLQLLQEFKLMCRPCHHQKTWLSTGWAGTGNYQSETWILPTCENGLSAAWLDCCVRSFRNSGTWVKKIPATETSEETANV